ncbi:MAG: efflux RND transporter permease subunit [Synoicihabitans sp.]
MADSNHTSDLGERPRGLIAWFNDNHVAANILMMFLVIGGIISATQMRTETFPAIDPRLITVSVPYPGATPYEVADGITSRVEQALQGIEGVKRITSTASEGLGLVRVELNDFADADDVYNEVETAVNSLVSFPPADAERPIVTKVKATPNVLTLAIFGEASEKTLRFWADTIEDELQQLPGVALVQLRGIRDYEISIEVSENELRNYGLTIEDVGNAVRAFSSDTPAGLVESEQGEILLRVQEQRFTGPEFAQIVVRALPDGSVLRLGDIARVDDGFEDTNLVSRFDGSRAAFIDVKRSESEDTLAVAETVKTYLAGLSLPAGVELALQQDETTVLKDRISLMMRNALLGFALVFIILLLFLDLKLAIWTSAAIPISFLGGLIILSFLGYSLNMVSLFALIVVLGIVVDDGIVTGESIFEAQERAPDDKYSVLTGVRAIIAPVSVGVATTMAAFAPLLFSTGTLGQIVGVVPAVVIAILFISLIEAYFILPAHLSSPKRWSRGVVARTRDWVTRTLARFVENRVVPFARFTIRFRYATIAAFFGITILTVGLIQGGFVRFIFFPQIEGDRITVSLTMPQGTPFDVTSDRVDTIEQAVREVRDEIEAESGQSAFESVSVSIGTVQGQTGGPGGGAGGGSGSHLGELRIQLLPSDFRDYSASEIEGMIRQRVRTLPGIESLEFQSSLIGGGADIEIELSHPEEAKLNEAAARLRETLETIAGTLNVANSFQAGKTEYLFELTEEGLAVGLTPSELGRQLRFAYFGMEVQRLQRGQSEVLVFVRYPKEAREDISTLQQTRIRLRNGDEVPLNTVARVKEQIGFSEINSVNGRRIVSVTADVDAAETTPNEVIALLNASILPELRDRYPSLNLSFEGETRDQAEDLASLARNMFIALMIIYVILGAQLRSYVQPFVIMSAIPFGVIGAILGHLLLGYDLTFISLFGIVALTGVVVNDSVVLIDFLNQRVKEGTQVFEAALAAIQRRFRPILLTTLSTCLGLLPMMLETSLQARFLIPMVVSLATGIVFATPIILILIPSLIMVVEDVKSLTRRVFRIR